MAWVTKLQGSDGALRYQGRYRDPFGAKRAVGTYLLAAVIVSGPQHQQLCSRHEPLSQTTTRKPVTTRDTRGRAKGGSADPSPRPQRL